MCIFLPCPVSISYLGLLRCVLTTLVVTGSFERTNLFVGCSNPNGGFSRLVFSSSGPSISCSSSV